MNKIIWSGILQSQLGAYLSLVGTEGAYLSLVGPEGAQQSAYVPKHDAVNLSEGTLEVFGALPGLVRGGGSVPP